MSLLHLDRPCRVRRLPNGRWGWSCWCCPMPLQLITTTADTFRLALDDADTHIRTEHTATPMTNPETTATTTTTDVLEIAA